MVQYLKWSETGELVTAMLGTELDVIGGGSRTGRCALELILPDDKEDSREFFTRLEKQSCGAVVNMLFKESGGLVRRYEMTVLPVSAPGQRNRLLSFFEPGETEAAGVDDLEVTTARFLRRLTSAFLDIGHGVPDQWVQHKDMKVLDLKELLQGRRVSQESETSGSGLGYGLLKRTRRQPQYAR